MITAVVLAAGSSSRMGKPKMTLAWGKTTVLGQILTVLKEAGLGDVLVVTGAVREAVEDICHAAGVRTAHNQDFQSGEMLSSVQLGLREASKESQAALIVLGDQPAIQTSVVQGIMRCYSESGVSLIMPSFEHRRGHPWLVGRELWPRLLEMHAPETPRDFLNRRAGIIHYVEVDTPTVVEDIDTPEDYLRLRP